MSFIQNLFFTRGLLKTFDFDDTLKIYNNLFLLKVKGARRIPLYALLIFIINDYTCK